MKVDSRHLLDFTDPCFMVKKGRYLYASVLSFFASKEEYVFRNELSHLGSTSDQAMLRSLGPDKCQLASCPGGERDQHIGDSHSWSQASQKTRNVLSEAPARALPI
jgi:hypothetical protein